MRALLKGYAPIPPPILQSLRVLADASTSFQELARLLDDVPGLKHRLLRIANSPLFAAQQPVLNVRQAAVMIGLRSVNLIILADTLRPYIDRLTRSYGHTHHGLWTHLVAVAATAGSIGEYLRLDLTSCARAFVAGLFHDVGKILMADYLTCNNLPFDLGASPREAPGLVRLEGEVLGASHVEAGRILVEHWGLEPPICDLVARHHDMGETGTPELAVLHLADYFVSSFAVGYREDLPPETFLDPTALAWCAGRPDFMTSCEAIALRESARAMDLVQALQ